MFTPAAAIFTIFSLLYFLLTGAVVYHLRQYTLQTQRAPRLVTKIFLSLAILFWLFALYFLFKIPS